MRCMARQTVVRLTCDVCGVTRKVKPFRVSYSSRGNPRHFDLCEEHARPLVDLREAVDGRADRRRRQMVVEER